MKHRFISILLAVVAVAACHKAQPGNSQTDKVVAATLPQLECSVTATEWLPTTPEPSADPAPNDPEDCFFYRAAWQNFMFATTADTGGEPAFLGYPNIATIFGTKVAEQEFVALRANTLGVAVRDMQRPNSLPINPSHLATVAEGVRQAGGLFGLVVDGYGNPIYYSIHVNKKYAEFIKDKGLTTKAAVESNPDLEFPPGVAEYKAAWAVVPTGSPVDLSYIHAQVELPNLDQDANGVLRVGSGTHKATLKLIAFHVAFVIKDHPEFVWATFDHVRPDGVTDVAPSAASNDAASVISQVAGNSYTIFAGGATRTSANAPCPGKAPPCDPTKDHPVFDAKRQTFAGQQTSIFREFPSSKSDRDQSEDQSVVDLNISMRANLAPTGGKRDVRANYRLVGAIWLEHPRDGNGRTGDFAIKKPFANPPGQDTEDRSRILAGEDALSSTAMESFTQRDSTNCFSCHDTRAVRSDEDGSVILKPTRLNVSHVISRFLSGTK